MSANCTEKKCRGREFEPGFPSRPGEVIRCHFLFNKNTSIPFAHLLPLIGYVVNLTYTYFIRKLIFSKNILCRFVR